MTPTTYSYKNEDGLDELDDRFDYFACGSDQIWNLNCTGGIVGSYFSSFIKGKRKASYTQSLAHTSFRPENDNREGPRRVLSSFDYARGKARVCHNNCWQLLSCLVVSEPLGSGGLSELHADIHFCRSTIHDCIQCSAGGLGNAFATKSGEDDFRRFRAGSALTFGCISVAASCILCLTQPFMEIWVGRDAMLVLYFVAYETAMLFSLSKDVAGMWLISVTWILRNVSKFVLRTPFKR